MTPSAARGTGTVRPLKENDPFDQVDAIFNDRAGVAFNKFILKKKKKKKKRVGRPEAEAEAEDDRFQFREITTRVSGYVSIKVASARFDRRGNGKISSSSPV